MNKYQNTLFIILKLKTIRFDEVPRYYIQGILNVILVPVSCNTLNYVINYFNFNIYYHKIFHFYPVFSYGFGRE